MIFNNEIIDLLKWVQFIVCVEWIVEVFDVEFMCYQNIEGELVVMFQIVMKCVDLVFEN